MSEKHTVIDDLAQLKLRVNALRLEYIGYERADAVQADMETLRVRDNTSSEGAILKLIGGSRSGKSKILRDFVSRFPAVPRGRDLGNGAFADFREVVYLRVPDASLKNFMERLLAELSNRTTRQIASRGFRRFDIQEDVLHYARLIGLKLLVLEEAHQAINNKDAAKDLASALKDMTNEASFSLVVAGTPVAESLFEVSSELEGRVMFEHELTPLRWEVPAERAMFLTVIKGLDEYLEEAVFGRISELTRAPFAKALLKVAAGQIGHAATLIEKAALTAVEEIIAGKAKGLTTDHFVAALAGSPLRRNGPDAFFEMAAEHAAEGGNAGAAETIEERNVPTTSKGRKHRSGHDARFRP